MAGRDLTRNYPSWLFGDLNDKVAICVTARRLLYNDAASLKRFWVFSAL